MSNSFITLSIIIPQLANIIVKVIVYFVDKAENTALLLHDTIYPTLRGANQRYQMSDIVDHVEKHAIKG